MGGATLADGLPVVTDGPNPHRVPGTASPCAATDRLQVAGASGTTGEGR